MGKQTRSKKSENFGKGKVTPVQVAFIVDRYLADNSFSETRSRFRSEASTFISKSPVREAPKSLLTLDSMLNEYICLKEQKVMVEQEKARLDQEKFRIQNLLQGMQNVMSSYNASGSVPPPMIRVPQFTTATKSVVVANQTNLLKGSPPTDLRTDTSNNSTLFTSQSVARKRRCSEIAKAGPVDEKKTRSRIHTHNATAGKNFNTVPQSYDAISDRPVVHSSSSIQSESHNSATHGSSVQVPTVNQPPPSCPVNRNFPETSLQEISSHSDKSTSPPVTAICGNNSSPQDVPPTNCTVISTERIRVSPSKKLACYTVERSHCISSSPVKNNPTRLNKRDHVKGRLDFDASDEVMCLEKSNTEDNSTSESEKETNICDMDLFDLDAFGENFSFSDLLVDLDIDFDGIGYNCDPSSGLTMDTDSGSSPESGNGNLVTDQIFSEYSSTTTEVLSGNDMNIRGPDSLTAVKSITKCIRILSPTKQSRPQNCMA